MLQAALRLQFISTCSEGHSSGCNLFPPFATYKKDFVILFEVYFLFQQNKWLKKLALSGALLAPQILPKESLESKTESIKLEINPLLVSFN